jgi:histidine ammonia-lyase
LFNAAQALEFRRPGKSSNFIENFIGEYRKMVPTVQEDRILHYDIIKSIEFLSEYQFQ